MGWETLTNRQKSLDRAIESCGIKLDNSNECLSRVMSAIRASDSEADYVKQRIELRLRTATLCNSQDLF